VPPPPDLSAYTDPTGYSSAASASLTAPNEIVATRRAQVTVDGQLLNYTSTVGHLTALERGTGAPRASFFYAAYTLDGADPATRPVTFFYNGGPGSATMWLHLGSFGPRRIATGVPRQDLPRPFEIVPNNESLLDVSDLVFVDAVGSGYSMAIAPNTNRTFWGVDDDAAVFRDFVMRYAIANNRAASPKFIYGESYGGPRTGVLADLLEAAGVHVTGVILQSPAMNYNSNCGISDRPSLSCSGYLPSYGASGAWFQKSTPSPAAANLEPFIANVRTLADSRYEPAVLTWLANHTPPDTTLLGDLANASGIGIPGWQSNFNMGPSYYRVNLIPGTLLGGYDARIFFQGSSNANVDPSDGLINASFTQRLPEYLTSLGYTNPSIYTTLSGAINVWRFDHDGQALPDTIPDLASAMAQNPRLKVLSVNGFHDLVTPFHTTEKDLARLGNPNVSVRNYQGGHMTYLDDVSRPQMKRDLAAFYRSALAN
jgi:carboxypeptidase C (cathepsin A)